VSRSRAIDLSCIVGWARDKRKSPCREVGYD
jgi:hypothetical protein